MAVDNRQRSHSVRERIDVDEMYELEYWTNTLNVTADQLREVVRRVGPMSDDVQRALGRA